MQHPSLWQRMKDARWCYLFIAPSLILALLFTFYPIVASWYFSTLNWSGFTAHKEFIGLDNYREVLQDKYFWNAYKKTFMFMFGSVPARLAISLILAIILNDASLRLSPVLRTMFFVPVVTTAAIVGIVMTLIFSPFNGPVNSVLMNLGIVNRPMDFLGNPDTALWTVVAVHVWKNMGITMIYWLAALQVVPLDLYESAKLDGANAWKMFRDITLPLILPFAAIITLITVVQTLQVFPIVQAMTGGGPFFASEVMEVFIFRNAFGSSGIPRLGFSSAAGVIFGVTVMFIAIFQAVAMTRLRRQTARVQGGA